MPVAVVSVGTPGDEAGPHRTFSRPPCWRWKRAQSLATSGRPLDPRIDDEWVSLARSAIMGVNGHKPQVAATIEARDFSFAEPPERRWEMDARLLTDEPLDRVARRFGITPAAVEAYAALFFDVRGVRAASDWLLVRAVGYRPGIGFAKGDLAGVWKFAAYRGGALLLDAVIAAATDGPFPAGWFRETGAQLAFEEAAMRARIKLWVASEFALTDEEFAALVDARQRFRNLDAGLVARGLWVPSPTAAMESFLKMLPAWTRNGRLRPGEEGAEAAEGSRAGTGKLVSPRGVAAGRGRFYTHNRGQTMSKKMTSSGAKPVGRPTAGPGHDVALMTGGGTHSGEPVAAAATPAPGPPPPGLDADRHAAAQRAAFQADMLRQTVFPALMADAIGYDQLFDGRAYKVYLERLLADAGNPTDPVEVMLLEQLALAHLRIGQMHVTAGRAQGLEATKILNGAASRLLGEFRRTALALRAYRGRVPKRKTSSPLKLVKAAL